MSQRWAVHCLSHWHSGDLFVFDRRSSIDHSLARVPALPPAHPLNPAGPKLTARVRKLRKKVDAKEPGKRAPELFPGFGGKVGHGWLIPMADPSMDRGDAVDPDTYVPATYLPWDPRALFDENPKCPGRMARSSMRAFVRISLLFQLSFFHRARTQSQRRVERRVSCPLSMSRRSTSGMLFVRRSTMRARYEKSIRSSPCVSLPQWVRYTHPCVGRHVGRSNKTGHFLEETRRF